MTPEYKALFAYYSNTLPSLTDINKFNQTGKANGIKSSHWKFLGSQPLTTVEYLRQARRLLRKDIRFDVFLSWNPNDPVFGIWHRYLKDLDIPVLALERALIPDMLSLGLNFKKEKVYYAKDNAELGRQILQQTNSGHIYKKRKKFKARGQIDILVLGSWHSVMDRSTLLTPETCQLAEKIAAEFPQLTVAYKPHPLASKHYNKICKKCKIFTNDPIELISQSSVVVTSGTKLELDVTLMRKPLILAGGGFLSSLPSIPVARDLNECIIFCKEAIARDTDQTHSELECFIGHEAQHNWYDLQNKYTGTNNTTDFFKAIHVKAKKCQIL